MTRRHSTTYAALRIEAVRISTETFDDDTAPDNPRNRSGRNNAPPFPSEAPETTSCGDRRRIIDLGDRT